MDAKYWAGPPKGQQALSTAALTAISSAPRLDSDSRFLDFLFTSTVLKEEMMLTTLNNLSIYVNSLCPRQSIIPN